MHKVRLIFIPLMFTLAGFIVVFTGIQTILGTPDPQAEADPVAYVLLLLSISAFSLVALGLLRAATRRLLLWATAGQHLRIIKFIRWIAPGFSRKILGSMLGTSLALSTVTVANASPSLTHEIHAATTNDDNTRRPEAVGQTQPSVPSAQWFPEQVSVPMNSLISQGAHPRREPAKKRAEVVVAAGDNLWSIAAKRLGPQATAEDISTYWPRIYQVNKKLVGSDPNHLIIGTVLVLPPSE